MRHLGLLLSGPPGAGKTTVAWRVFDFSTDAGDDPAFIDLDLMGAAWPAPDDDPDQSRLKAANVAAVWGNYRAGGSRRLVIAGVVESVVEREMLAQAIGMPVVVVRLAAPDDVLRQRIEQRGRDHGAGLAKLIRRAAELQVQLVGDDIADFVVDTEDRSVDEVAREVLIGWVAASR